MIGARASVGHQPGTRQATTATAPPTETWCCVRWSRRDCSMMLAEPAAGAGTVQRPETLAQPVPPSRPDCHTGKKQKTTSDTRDPHEFQSAPPQTRGRKGAVRSNKLARACFNPLPRKREGESSPPQLVAAAVGARALSRTLGRLSISGRGRTSLCAQLIDVISLRASRTRRDLIATRGPRTSGPR